VQYFGGRNGHRVIDAACFDAQDLTAQHDELPNTLDVKANRIYVDHVCWHGGDAPQPSI
jgi:hypothetical protein